MSIEYWSARNIVKALNEKGIALNDLVPVNNGQLDFKQLEINIADALDRKLSDLWPSRYNDAENS